MKLFSCIQEEHKEWAKANFGKQDIIDYKLGLIEEKGELAHSVLKRKQGIRNTENHNAKIKDHIADITIYLIGLCNLHGLDLDIPFNGSDYTHVTNIEEAVVGVDKIISLIINDDLFSTGMNCSTIALLSELFSLLRGISAYEGFGYIEAVLYTWHEIVKRRNWVKNPDNIKHFCNEEHF